MIRFNALGAVDLRDDGGRELSEVLAQPKRLALLSYLAIARPRRFHRREVLLSLFWPRSDRRTGRNSLRQALHFLRRALGEGVIVRRGEHEIGVAHGSLWCDATAFVTSLDIRATDEAMALYRGPLMPGTLIPEAPEFNRWLDDERDYLRLRVEETLETQANEAERHGNHTLAVRARRRSSALEPLSTRVALALMQTLASAGDRAAAIQHAAVFTRALHDELDVECDETISTFAAALRRKPRSMLGDTAVLASSSPLRV
jgi:DNA-binding SARP family transcriptional activator